MKAIKTFFSLALLFVFACVLSMVLFSVHIFLRHGLFCFQTHSFLCLYLEVLFYSFPLALVVAGLVCVYSLVRSNSFSSLIFLFTLFSIAFLGFYGLHRLVQRCDQERGCLGCFPYSKSFENYSAKNAYFFFRTIKDDFLRDVVVIEPSKPLGALGFYGEGVWDKKSQSLRLLPLSSKEGSLILQPCLCSSVKMSYEPFRSAFNLFCMDVYYVSYFFMTQNFGIFLLNLLVFIGFIFTVSRFSSLFSGITAVMVMICLLRFIFWAYRCMAFNMSFIVQNFGLFNLSVVAYFPIFFVMLANLSLAGVWRLLSERKIKELEKA